LDIGKIFDNARLFNPKDSPVHQCAVILEKRFDENLQKLKNEMTKEITEERGRVGNTEDEMEEPVRVDEEDYGNLMASNLQGFGSDPNLEVISEDQNQVDHLDVTGEY